MHSALAMINDLLQPFENGKEYRDNTDELLIYGYAHQYADMNDIPNCIIDLIKIFKKNEILVWKVTDYNTLKLVNVIDIKSYYILGGENIMFVTNNGSLHCIGDNDCGQFLIDKSIVPRVGIEKPFKSLFFGSEYNRKIKLISEGVYSNHNFVVLENDDIYSFGSNEHGELGIDKVTSWDNNETYLNAQKVDIFQIKQWVNNKECVLSIRCGARHSIILTCSPNNNIYGCGRNTFGQLGLGHCDTPCLVFTLNEALIDIKCKIINCGINSSYVIDYDGNLWVFGSCNNGRLGLGDITNDQLSPIKINFFKNKNIKIEQIGCGDRHACCLSDDNNVYTFGCNYYGQCGNGTNDDVLLPFHVEIERIIKAECGSRDTKLLDKDNNIYTFGYNEYGECLLDPQKFGDSILSPHFVSFDVLKSKQVQDDYFAKIIDIKSAAHTFIVTD